MKSQPVRVPKSLLVQASELAETLPDSVLNHGRRSATAVVRLALERGLIDLRLEQSKEALKSSATMNSERATS